MADQDWKSKQSIYDFTAEDLDGNQVGMNSISGLYNRFVFF